jgi:AcrR family transcriptional regulator
MGDVDEQPPRRKRADRVPAEEVRQRMLDAGRTLALESGVGLTIESLRLEEVIQRAHVPRSSAYRLWPYKDDYIDDLLCYMAGAGSWFAGRDTFDPETFNLARKTIEDNRALLATPEGRRAVLREVVRVAAGRNYHAVSESLYWRIHMALIATVGSTRRGEARDRIAAALEEAQTRSRKSLVGLFDYLSAELGLRIRDPERTAEHLSLAGGILVQGLALRNVQVQATVAPESDALLNRPIPGPGLDGGTAEWSLAAFAYLGIFDAFIELDPGFQPR